MFADACTKRRTANLPRIREPSTQRVDEASRRPISDEASCWLGHCRQQVEPFPAPASRGSLVVWLAGSIRECRAVPTAGTRRSWRDEPSGEQGFEARLVDFRPTTSRLAQRAQQPCSLIVDLAGLGVDPSEAQALFVQIFGTHILSSRRDRRLFERDGPNPGWLSVVFA